MSLKGCRGGAKRRLCTGITFTSIQTNDLCVKLQTSLIFKLRFKLRDFYWQKEWIYLKCWPFFFINVSHIWASGLNDADLFLHFQGSKLITVVFSSSTCSQYWADCTGRSSATNSFLSSMWCVWKMCATPTVHACKWSLTHVLPSLLLVQYFHGTKVWIYSNSYLLLMIFEDILLCFMHHLTWLLRSSQFFCFPFSRLASSLLPPFFLPSSSSGREHVESAQVQRRHGLVKSLCHCILWTILPCQP